MAKKKADEPSKAEMVRQAVAAGKESPEDGVAWIKETFGVDLPRPTFSSYKSQEKARQEKKSGGEAAPKGRPGRKPRAAAPVASAPAALPPSGMNGPAGLATSVEAIKVLVEQYGVDQVVSIARLFAK